MVLRKTSRASATSVPVAARGRTADVNKRKSRRNAPATETFPIVGIGASAGGLDAFKKFFSTMPADCGMAFVLIQHLDPTRESLTAELVGTYTPMRVVQAEDGMRVEANRVYVIPPNRYLSIRERTLRLSAPTEPRSLRMAVDFFLRSLAADQQENGRSASCLSGTGTDGTLGLKEIKAAGGMTMVQDPADRAARRHAAQRDRQRQRRLRPAGRADGRRPARVRAARARDRRPAAQCCRRRTPDSLSTHGGVAARIHQVRLQRLQEGNPAAAHPTPHEPEAHHRDARVRRAAAQTTRRKRPRCSRTC